MSDRDQEMNELREQRDDAIQRAVKAQHKLDAIEIMVRGLSWVLPAPEYAALLEILDG